MGNGFKGNGLTISDLQWKDEIVNRNQRNYCCRQTR